MPDSPAPVQRFLSTGDLARIFALEPNSINKAIHRGSLPQGRLTLGGQHRWTPEEIVTFLRDKGRDIPPELALLAGESPPDGAST